MPYRRLPNTDKARIRALQKAIDGYENAKNGRNVLSPKTIYEIKLKLTEFNAEVEAYNQAFLIQTENQKKHKEIYQSCKLYVSHFIQVMNFAIIRGEFNKKIRKFYQLKINSSNLPTFNTEKQLILWTEKIIEGEEKRISEGGKSIENPSLYKLRINFEAFKDSINYQKNLQNKTNYAQSRLVNMRPGVDLIIKELWDEIETFFEKYPPLIRREKAKVFGIIYIYRKNEEKIELEDLFKL
ncbi:MAG: hypothetical protein JXR68_05240 [Bacteroidales bacterium]|nr:hypothetical protein [Bacteroidales bacterium]